MMALVALTKFVIILLVSINANHNVVSNKVMPHVAVIGGIH
jgi:hypothetical protein